MPTLSTFTPIDLILACCAAEGLTNQQIAEQVALSPETINWHFDQAFQRLDVRNRTALALLLYLCIADRPKVGQ